MVNSRFTVAIHVLCLLAWCQQQQLALPLTSEFIAGSVNTNPVVIRRLLANLRKAGVVRSQGGSAGGWELLRPAREISLLEIYQLVDPGSVFSMHHRDPNPKCKVGRNIQGVLSGYFDRAQRAMEAELALLSIADILTDVDQVPETD
jgi:Rrf2 family protein